MICVYKTKEEKRISDLSNDTVNGMVTVLGLMALTNKRLPNVFRSLSTLSYADSNHDKQNQNLLCYHYTIRQS